MRTPTQLTRTKDDYLTILSPKLWTHAQDRITSYKPGFDWAEKVTACDECGQALEEGQQHWILELSARSRKERKKIKLRAVICDQCFPSLNGVILDKLDS